MEGGNCVLGVERMHEMKAPSIVARLMGLESIPTSKRAHKSKKSSFSDSEDGEESLEIGVANASHDSRPQKVRKTEANEKRAMTRFGAEALQIKNVLSQVRKCNHHHSHRHAKFVSPLKSPRVSSGKSASRSSRLIEAATKILEPGFQATSRSKYSLTSSVSKCPRKNGIVTDMVGTRAEAIHNRPCYNVGIDKSLVEHTCKNCGNLVDVEINKPTVSDVFTGFSSESALKGRSFSPSHENDIVLLRSQEKIITLVDEDVKKNAYSCNESTSRRIHVHAKCDSSHQPPGGLEDNDFDFKTQTRERMLSGERMAFRFEARNSNMLMKRVSSAATASTVSGSKDFVGVNRRLSGRTRTRSPTKLDSCNFDLERKKRTESIASVNLVTLKHRNVGSNTQGGKRRNFDAFSPNNSNVKCRKSGYQKTDKINDNKINKVETRSANVIKTCFQRHHSPLTEDVLGAFLEQKLKELKSRKNEESANGDQPRRSTVLILQELISVLNAGSGSFHTGSINCSYDQPKRFEHDVKLIGCKILTELVNRIHTTLQSVNSFWPRLTKNKLNHMKDVIFIAELVLGNVTRQSEDLPQLLISCILVDELDNMATDAMRGNFNRSQLKGFLFDCVVEYLESNCCHNYYNVFSLWCAWTKIPLCMKGEILVEEVKSEIKKWEVIAGMEPEKIIDWEMSHSLGKWTDFNVEAFEFGVDIENYLLQILVDEIVEDLVDFRHCTL
ncbi:uncharacterized protein LOC131624308 [Vicia villosa]|uniref:uncharacterized protein LOC131624308 n=1 Tax=Vicia villosa TaxID=3911 RepID=UPI00273AE636|nr:uncharacterized protein LOC131624308 [Vicia villosa]